MKRHRIAIWHALSHLAPNQVLSPAADLPDGMEKAGLQRDAVRSQLFDVLEAQRKGDRQSRRLAPSDLARLIGSPVVRILAKSFHFISNFKSNRHKTRLLRRARSGLRSNF